MKTHSLSRFAHLTALLLMLWPFSGYAAEPLFAVSLRAWHGDPQALTQLAKEYSQGFKLPKNQRKAIHLYQQAARQGYLEAQVALGKIFEQPQGAFLAHTDKALYWYKQAAAQGSHYAEERIAILAPATAAETKPTQATVTEPITVITTPVVAIAPENTQPVAPEIIPASTLIETATTPSTSTKKDRIKPLLATTSQVAKAPSPLALQQKQQEEASFLADHGFSMAFSLGLPLLLWLGLSFSTTARLASLGTSVTAPIKRLARVFYR